MSSSSRMHRYEQIAGEIRTAIVRGTYDPDGRLPSERRLVRAYGAQRNTVRQALGLLEREGRIASVGKSGWFVSANDEPLAERTGRRILLVTFRRHESASTDAIAHGLGRALTAEGTQVLRFDSTGRQQGAHVAAVEELTAIGADGFVMWPHGPVEAALMERLRAVAPLVLIDRRAFGFASDSVRFDDLGGGRLVTEHLLAQGHRRIAFLGDEPFAESVQTRWNGYRQALEAAGHVPDDNLTVFTHGQHEPAFGEALRFILQGLPEPPTAIVCSNDGVASRLLLLMREKGIRVPEDIAVTGFGDERPSYLDLMGLTTVAQSFDELGYAAGRLLLERLSESPARRVAEWRDILLPMRLVPRASSGA